MEAQATIFPITLSDRVELERFVSGIAERAATEVLIQTGYIKPMMYLAECYRLSSRRKVDAAIKNGKLKCVKKGANILIKREHFEKWSNTHDFLL
jgi:hypothetical protein